MVDRLREKIRNEIYFIDVEHESSPEFANVVEVSWVDKASKNVVWSKSKEECEGRFDSIIDKLKENYP